MRRYVFNNVSLAVPPTWTDLSVITLAGEGQLLAPSVVITREDAPSGALADFVTRQQADLKKQLKGYKLLQQGPTQVAGRDGVELVHHFVTPERTLARQRQLYVVAEREVLVLTLTGAENEQITQQPVFRAVLDSLRIE